MTKHSIVKENVLRVNPTGFGEVLLILFVFLCLSVHVCLSTDCVVLTSQLTETQTDNGPSPGLNSTVQ